MNFSTTEIKDAWGYAEHAYLKQAELKRIFGDSLTIFDPKLQGIGDACYLIEEGERVVVAFPGSNDIKDWLLNFRFSKTDDGFFHKGFTKDLAEMLHKIINRIEKINPNSVLITGHSRGGAVADLFAEMASPYLRCDINCITFAQPRIATKAYYTLLAPSNVKKLRVTVANDIVVDVPPRWFGFVHSGEHMELGNPLSLWEKAKRLYTIYRSGKNLSLISIKAHIPATYARYISNL